MGLLPKIAKIPGYTTHIHVQRIRICTGINSQMHEAKGACAQSQVRIYGRTFNFHLLKRIKMAAPFKECSGNDPACMFRPSLSRLICWSCFCFVFFFSLFYSMFCCAKSGMRIHLIFLFLLTIIVVSGSSASV